MKRIWNHMLCLMVSAGMVLAGFSGCAASQNNTMPDKNHPVAVEIWHYYNGPQKNAFDAMVDEFNRTEGARQGITVRALNQGTVGELADKIIRAAKKEVGAAPVPDVFAAYPDTAYCVEQMGLLADLDSYLTPEELAQFVPGYVQEGRFSGEALRIFPVAKSTEVLMLNETAWEPFSAACGISLDALNTIEGITETAREYYEWTDAQTPAPDDGKAFFGRDALANYMLAGSRQLGGELLPVEGGAARVNLSRETARKLWDNYYVPMLNGWFCANGKFRSQDMKAGDLISFVCSTSGAAYFPDEISVTDTQTVPSVPLALPAPVFSGCDSVAVQQGAGMAVFQSDKKREYAAVQFLKWFTEQERNIAFATESGYLPVRSGANEPGALDASLESGGAAEALRLGLRAGAQTVRESEMYVATVFENADKVRGVLETSFPRRLEQDEKKVDALLSAGETRAQAVGAVATEGAFEEWYTGLKQELEKITADQRP